MGTNFKHFKQSDGSLKIQLNKAQVETIRKFYGKEILSFNRGEMLAQGNGWYLIVSKAEVNRAEDISALLGNIRVALAYNERLPQLKALAAAKAKEVADFYKAYRGKKVRVVCRLVDGKGRRPQVVAVNRALSAYLNKDLEITREIQTLIKKATAPKNSPRLVFA